MDFRRSWDDVFKLLLLGEIKMSKILISVASSPETALEQSVTTVALEFTDGGKKAAQTYAKKFGVKLTKFTENSSPNSDDEAVFSGKALNILKLLAAYDGETGSPVDIKELVNLID